MPYEILKQYDALFEEKKNLVLKAPDEVKIGGAKYYVSCEGDDGNDGKSPETPWKTLDKVSNGRLLTGDGVLFRRGDLFRAV